MNYPKGVKNNNTENYIKFDNRGMDLENDINITNQYYIDKAVAYIYKKPTPIQVTKVEYNNNSLIIKEGYFKEPSTTDYNGLYNGLYIDFEAKETSSKTSFPLSNIHKHQIVHLKHIIENGGIGFLIVRFTNLNKTFVLMASDLIEHIKNNERKSVPLKYFEEKGYEIEMSYMPRLDYLKIIDKIIGGVKNGKQKEKSC